MESNEAIILDDNNDENITLDDNIATKEETPVVSEEKEVVTVDLDSVLMQITSLQNELVRVNSKLENQQEEAKTKKKLEKSVILCAICIFTGIACIASYYVAIFMGLDCDASVATTALTTLIGSVVSYCLYQFGLKNSRNKYGVDENGQPYKEKFSYEDDDDDSNMNEEVETVSSEGAVG